MDPAAVARDRLIALVQLWMVIQRQRQARRRIRRKPVVWMKDYLTKRRQQGQFHTLLVQLRDPTSVGHAAAFQNYMRMDGALFEEILAEVGPLIERQDSNFRECIGAGERLAITLRFLATGASYPTLQHAYRCQRSTISKIVAETCRALIQKYDHMIKCPNTVEQWRDVANRFKDRWNFPHTLGALDGKHVRIRKPDKSGSVYYNYKGYFSVILMALVNADYQFMYIDVGNAGSCGDSTIFQESELLTALEADAANLPPDEVLDNDDQPMPYFIVGDKAFRMRTWLMKPYSLAHVTEEERIFNYRLSRCRRTVECTFGILVSRLVAIK